MQHHFKIRDPQNADSWTKATLLPSPSLPSLPSNLCADDNCRLEVVSSSPKHAVVQVPRHIGYCLTSELRTKPVLVVNPLCLGFVDKRTEIFRTRPHAREFLLLCSRVFQLTTVCPSRAIDIRSGCFSIYYLLFSSEMDNLGHHLMKYNLDSTNTIILDTPDSDLDVNVSIVPVSKYKYIQQNIRDVRLDVHSSTCFFLQSVADKSNLGIHVNKWICR